MEGGVLDFWAEGTDRWRTVVNRVINKSFNTNKCTVISYMLTIFYIAATCFGAIISPSSGS
jgi:hypothetical protein